MKEQFALQKLLNGKLEEIRSKNPAYSLRAFSKRLAVNPSTLTRIINGERNVSRPLAERLCIQLSLDPHERAEIMDAFPQRKRYRTAGRPGPLSQTYLQLSTDQFKTIGEWYHFAILSLIRTQDFQSDPKWISERLAISISNAREALQRLERLGLIQKDPAGNWTRTQERFRTTDDVLNLSLQKGHRQNLELALDSLVKTPVALRDFTAITMPTSPSLLPKAKELIRKFQDDLCELLESEPGSEVYKFCAQLFPLTQIKTKTQEKLK